MPRPYRLGNRNVTQEVFDSEVKRLYVSGLTEVEIAKRLHRSRWPIGKAIKRIDLTPQQKDERKWAALSNDEFYELGEIKPWIESMKLRRIGQTHIIRYTNQIKSVADSFQIYPSMLDVEWCKKWLLQPEQQSRSLAQLRSDKVALRQWLKFAFKLTDTELAEAGFDAKHYETGKWSHVRLSDEQIERIDGYLGERWDAP